MRHSAHPIIRILSPRRVKRVVKIRPESADVPRYVQIAPDTTFNYAEIFKRPFMFSPGTFIEFYSDGKVKNYFTFPTTGGIFESPNYRLRPMHLDATSRAPIYISLDEQQEITGCQSCIGKALVGGRNVEIGINPKNSMQNLNAVYPSYMVYGKSGERSLDLYITQPVEFSILGVPAKFAADSQLRLGEIGSNIEVYRGELAQEISIPIQGVDVWFRGEISISGNGAYVYYGRLARPAKLKDGSGKEQDYPAGVTLEFRDDGSVGRILR